MRKPLSTQKLERILRLLPTLIDGDILRLQLAVNNFVRLRRTVNDRVLLGHERRTNDSSSISPVAAQPDEPGPSA